MRFAPICLVALFSMASCGGDDGGFDRDAVETQLDVSDDLVLDRYAELCNDTIDEVYTWALLDFRESGDLASLRPQEIGCRDRYTQVADEYGWPQP